MADRRITDVAAKFLQVKDWREFQHYHDRSPAWIKLHKKILDNADFQSLPVASRALAPMLWLLASEHHEGLIPWNPSHIAWRLRMNVNELDKALTPLIKQGFFVLTEVSQEASEQLALTEQDASLDKEKNKSREEKEAEALASALASWIPTGAWNDFVKMRKKMREPFTEHAQYLAMLDLDKLRKDGHDPGRVLDQSVLRAWRGLFPVTGATNGKRESVFERMAEELDQKDRNGLPHV